MKSKITEYKTFLESKIEIAKASQPQAEDVQIDSSLFPHQSDATRWGLRRQRALIAMSFGLGKTRPARNDRQAVSYCLSARCQAPVY
jgi:hypothetical protein